MKCVNVWKICVAQWTNIFKPMQSVIKSCMRKEIHSKCKEDQWVSILVQRFIGAVSDSIVLLRSIHKLDFGVVSEENIYNYPKRLLKHLSLFHLHSCIRPTKATHHNGLNAEADTKIQMCIKPYTEDICESV